MFRVLRTLLISVVSLSLVYAPLFSLKARAQKQTSQNRPIPSSSRSSEREEGTLLVKFAGEAPKERQEFILQSIAASHQWLSEASGVVELKLKNGMDLDLALDSLRAFSGVIEWAEPNYLVKRAGTARSVGKAKATKLRKEKTVQPTTWIAVIDTGLDAAHPAFRNSLDKENRGWNFITEDDNIADDNGHGTQVAGIIAQSLSNVETQNFASLLPLKALDRSGTGTIADVVQAIDYAIAHHAAVINCSFGTPAYSRALLDAIKRAESAGVLIVAAAGNGAKNLSQSGFYPASYRQPNLISVAAADEFNGLAAFSNFQADLAAPGVSVRTAHLGNSYVLLTGTSAAAGFESAAAGRLKSRRAWVSTQAVRDALLKSVQSSFDLKENVLSKGMLNSEGAMSLFTSNLKEASNAPTINRNLTPAVKAALQVGNGDLDTMRNTQPQAPPAYSQTGTLPASTYDDPKPTNTANYDSYLTYLASDGNSTGIAGKKPQQSADPTAGSAGGAITSIRRITISRCPSWGCRGARAWGCRWA
jgi:subtilisin family serine protease